MTLQRCFLIAILFATLLANAQWDNSDIQFLTDNFMDKRLGNSSLKLDELGDVHMVYHQENGDINELWYAVRSADGEVQNAVQINDPEESLYNASIELSDSKNIFISYLKEKEGVKQLFIRDIKEGQEEEHQITNSVADVFSPHTAIDNNDVLHLTWVGQNEEGDYKIFYSNTNFIVNNDITEPEIEHLIFSNVNDPSKSLPNIDLTEDGLPHIIYVGPSGTGTKIQYGFKQSMNGNWINSFISQSPNKFDIIAKMQIENDLVHAVYAGFDSITGPNKIIYTTKEINESSWGSYAVVAWEEDISLESFIAEENMVHMAMLNADKNFVYANNENNVWQNNTVLTKALNQLEMTIDAAGNGLILANHPTSEAPQIILWGTPETVASINTQDSTIASLQTVFNADVKIYPNPTTDYLNIESLEKYHLAIFDVTGKLILQDKGGLNSKLNISNWTKGHYIVRLYNDTKQSFHKIIVR